MFFICFSDNYDYNNEHKYSVLLRYEGAELLRQG